MLSYEIIVFKLFLDFYGYVSTLKVLKVPEFSCGVFLRATQIRV